MDPLRPIRPGEDIRELLSASRANAVGRAALDVRAGQRSTSVQHAEGFRRAWRSSVKVNNWHTGATQFNRFELVPLSRPLWANMDTWSGSNTLKDKPLQAGVLPSVWIASHLNPRYASWGVALEPIGPFRFGRVAVGGLAVVRMHYDATLSYGSSGGAGGGWVDVHPDPGEGDDPRHGLERAHGRAKLVSKFYRDPPGGGDREYYAVVDLDQSNHVFPVQAKTTTTNPSATSVACYTGHGTSPNKLDTITLRRTAALAVGLAVGFDDLTDGVGTIGWARWNGEWNRSSEDGAFAVVRWPDKFEVEVQSDFDGYPFNAVLAASVKLYHPDKTGGAGGVGSAFSVPIGNPDGVRTTGATTQWHTVHGASGAFGTIHSDYFSAARQQTRYWLEAEPWLDAPYGTVRMLHNVAVAGTGPYPGWRWCHGGYTGVPDLRDRFIVGEGPSHSVGLTGGQATHGDGTNDHDDHTHAETVVQSGTGATVAATTGHDHSETDNEPPWYALAFAVRTAV